MPLVSLLQMLSKPFWFSCQSLTPATVGHAALSSPSTHGSMPTSSGSVLSSSGSGGRERERKPEGHQDASGGALPQPVACHPTPTALLPLILPAESPHPAPRKQIIMGRPGTGKEARHGDHHGAVASFAWGCKVCLAALPYCKEGRDVQAEANVWSGTSRFHYFSRVTGVSLECYGYDSCTLYYCLLAVQESKRTKSMWFFWSPWFATFVHFDLF